MKTTKQTNKPAKISDLKREIKAYESMRNGSTLSDIVITIKVGELKDKLFALQRAAAKNRANSPKKALIQKATLLIIRNPNIPEGIHELLGYDVRKRMIDDCNGKNWKFACEQIIKAGANLTI